MTLRIILVRHAETEHNRQRILSGRIDAKLSRIGWAQAKALGRRFSRERIDRIYSSPLSRALDTANEIARHHRGLRVAQIPALIERYHGRFQGKPGHAIPPDIRIKMDKHPADIFYRPGGGESWDDIRKRVKPFAAELVSRKDGTVVVVSHGGTLVALFCELTGFPLTHSRIVALKNAAIAEIGIGKEFDRNIFVLSFNDTSHLSSDLTKRGRADFLRLLLIRHGESEGNIRNVMTGQTDFPLTEKGKREAAALGARLSKERIDEVYSSPLSRAFGTAREIAARKGLKVMVVPELMERNFGSFEGRPFNEWIGWKRGNAGQRSVRPPRGESTEDVRKRMHRFFSRIKGERGKTIAIVFHGSAIRTMLAEIFDVDEKLMRPFFLDNTAIAEVVIGDGFLRLSNFNDRSHLRAQGTNR